MQLFPAVAQKPNANLVLSEDLLIYMVRFLPLQTRMKMRGDFNKTVQKDLEEDLVKDLRLSLQTEYGLKFSSKTILLSLFLNWSMLEKQSQRNLNLAELWQYKPEKMSFVPAQQDQMGLRTAAYNLYCFEAYFGNKFSKLAVPSHKQYLEKWQKSLKKFVKLLDNLDSDSLNLADVQTKIAVLAHNLQYLHKKVAKCMDEIVESKRQIPQYLENYSQGLLSLYHQVTALLTENGTPYLNKVCTITLSN